ncbi:hypothetical protein [Sphingomonas rubra]|uniref:Uncharacterized protein n=1 Tax=Sphingomonas rubra TaxID=634430 RepID=A0A1I5RV53_9SPHN|nr:hypothetical protein [Sphingomonas rubra]SFP62469.1 hypothetical protein SAMN04488241_104155 [Sphingomonas rubra]
MTDWHRIEREAYAEEARYRRRQELRGIVALWAPAIKDRPRDSRKGWTIYDGYVRNRDEEWTLWGAIVCTVAILLGRRWHDQAIKRWEKRYGKSWAWAPTPDLAYFDARSTGSGYDITRVQGAPGCRFSVFSDGECLM